MKRLLSLIMLIVSAAFVFSGCDRGKQASITGTWYGEWKDENKDVIKMTIMIEDNGRMTINSDSQSGNVTGSADFMWEADNGTFWYGCDEEELDVMQMESMEYEVSEKYLTLYYGDGSSFKFERN